MLPTKQEFSSFWHNVAALLWNRLELFSLELREEQDRFFRLTFLCLSSLAIALIGLVLLLLALLLVIPQELRPLTCLITGVVCLILGILGWWRLQRKLSHGPLPFATIRDEIRKDLGVNDDRP